MWTKNLLTGKEIQISKWDRWKYKYSQVTEWQEDRIEEREVQEIGADQDGLEQLGSKVGWEGNWMGRKLWGKNKGKLIREYKGFIY